MLLWRVIQLCLPIVEQQIWLRFLEFRPRARNAFFWRFLFSEARRNAEIDFPGFGDISMLL
jgi:hypothetical protein